MSTRKVRHWLQQWPVCLAGVVTLLLALTLYLFTLDNGLRLEELKGGDLITHQYAQVEGRPSNAPGYPLYSMGGWLWFRLGRLSLGHLFSPIEILSLYSTIWALAALLVFYLLALHLTDGRWQLAAPATIFYGTTYFFWYYAVSTEQYSSAVLQTLLLVLLALRWQQTRQDKLLAWMALVIGTCLANLVTTLLAVPALTLFILSQEPGLLQKRRLLLRLLGLALLPALSYAYVYIRGAQHPEWRGQGEWRSIWSWFFSFLSTPQGRSEMTLRLLPLDFSYLKLVPQELTWPLLLTGLLGLALLERHQALLAYGILVAYVLFSYIDRRGNWFQVIMPAYPLIVLGVARLLFVLTQRLPQPEVALWAAAGLLIVAAGERLLTNLPRANLRNRPGDNALCPGLAVADDMWTVGGVAPAVIVTYDEQLSFQYLQTMYGYGRRVQALPPSADTASVYYMSRLAAPLVMPVSNVWQQPQAAGSVLLARQPPKPLTGQEPGASLGPLSVLALGAESRQMPEPCGGNKLVVILEWQVNELLSQDINISARPTLDGRQLIQDGAMVQDDHPPLWGLVPTSSWQPGDRWQDSFTFSLPSGVQPDSLQLLAYVLAGDGTRTLWSTSLALPPPEHIASPERPSSLLR